MRILKLIKRCIEFYKFERRAQRLYRSIPSYEKLRKYIVYDWSNTSKFNLKLHHSDVKKLLPLESLIVESYYPTIPSIYVTYDKREFNKVMKNKMNEEVLKFLLKYDNYSKNVRRLIYENNKDTFDLLLDCIETKYYLDNGKEIESIMNYLSDSFKENNLHKVEFQDIDARVKFELEFIKVQRGKKEFEVQLNR